MNVSGKLFSSQHEQQPSPFYLALPWVLLEFLLESVVPDMDHVFPISNDSILHGVVDLQHWPQLAGFIPNHQILFKEQQQASQVKITHYVVIMSHSSMKSASNTSNKLYGTGKPVFLDKQNNVYLIRPHRQQRSLLYKGKGSTVRKPNGFNHILFHTYKG